jgi:topoisomerase-4 subunit B
MSDEYSSSSTDSVRKRPGMYLGGVGEEHLHLLADEILSNAMDEAIEGHATSIAVSLGRDGSLSVSDNGRGIPIEKHPRFGKSALEIIFTHLHPTIDRERIRAHTNPNVVGACVVNALSDWLWVEVARIGRLSRMEFVEGKPVTKLQDKETASDRKGTTVCFHPDPKIFGSVQFKPQLLYEMAVSKARSYSGVEILWSCHAERGDGHTPTAERLQFPMQIQN